MRPSLRWSLAAVLLVASLQAGCAKKKSCPAGETDCGGVCIDLQTSAVSCGTCLHLCPSGATCVAGGCQCPTGQTQCGDACVDTQTSAASCGGCNQPCGTGTCSAGSCTCDSGTTTCTVASGDGKVRCADTQNDPANCASCGNACLTGDDCTSGACVCTPPKTECAGGCFNLAADPRHCGADCGTAVACPATATCVLGTCTCPAGKTLCGSACVDLTSDPLHCGGCTTACATGAACSGSTCQACPAPKVDVCPPAPGVCVNTQSDPKNCGTCGHACPAGQVCITGSCCSGTTQKTCASSCCQGTACCGVAGDSCQLTHANGLGQTYFSCNPLDTWTHDDALAAADAWKSGTTFEGNICGPFTLSRQTATQCATWFYFGGASPGLLILSSGVNCECSAASTLSWH